MSKICISALEGNSQKLDGGAMFGNAPRAMWEKWIQPDSLGRIPLSCRCLLIEFDDQKILCETGIGAFFDPKLADRFGVQNSDRHMLLEDLSRLGIKESEIDYVILSHLHFDHAGGLLPTYSEMQSGNEDLLFSKARYVVGQEAFERAKNPHSRDRASFIPGLVEKLEKTGRLMIVDENSSELPLFGGRLSFRYTWGHTPGQMHAQFAGNSTTLVFCGDLVPGTQWVNLPITMGYDRFPEKLIDEKKELYDEAVPGNWLLFYTHDAKISASQVSLNESGKYVPIKEIEKLERYEI